MEGGHWDPVDHQRNSGHKLQAAAAWEKDKLLGIDTSATRKLTKERTYLWVHAVTHQVNTTQDFHKATQSGASFHTKYNIESVRDAIKMNTLRNWTHGSKAKIRRVL